MEKKYAIGLAVGAGALLYWMTSGSSEAKAAGPTTPPKPGPQPVVPSYYEYKIQLNENDLAPEVLANKWAARAIDGGQGVFEVLASNPSLQRVGNTLLPWSKGQTIRVPDAWGNAPASLQPFTTLVV